jgi:DNA gyrase/topoisomerase IV subunit B
VQNSRGELTDQEMLTSRKGTKITFVPDEIFKNFKYRPVARMLKYYF